MTRLRKAIAVAAALAATAAWTSPATAGPFGTAVPGTECITEGERADLMRETWKLAALLDREVRKAAAETRTGIEAACLESGAEAGWCRRIVSAGDPEAAEPECLEDGMAPESCVSVGAERGDDEWTAE